MSNNKQSRFKDLAYWKNNAEENYTTTPISVLKYIYKLEEHIETIKAQLPSDEEIDAHVEDDFLNSTGVHKYSKETQLLMKAMCKAGALWLRDKIQGGNNEQQ